MLQILERLDHQTLVTYQVTAGQKPIVMPRDFVFLFREEMRGSTWTAGGCSVQFNTESKSDKVRAWQYPGLMMAEPIEDGKTEFTWLLQCDFGGALPLYVLNGAMPFAMKLFCQCLRKELKNLKT